MVGPGAAQRGWRGQGGEARSGHCRHRRRRAAAASGLLLRCLLARSLARSRGPRPARGSPDTGTRRAQPHSPPEGGAALGPKKPWFCAPLLGPRRTRPPSTPALGAPALPCLSLSGDPPTLRPRGAPLVGRRLPATSGPAPPGHTEVRRASASSSSSNPGDIRSSAQASHSLTGTSTDLSRNPLIPTLPRKPESAMILPETSSYRDCKIVPFSPSPCPNSPLMINPERPLIPLDPFRLWTLPNSRVT